MANLNASRKCLYRLLCRIGLFIFLALALSPDQALAQSIITNQNASSPRTTAKIDEMTISCDELQRDLQTGVTILKGNVSIAYKDQFFSADEVHVDQKNQKAVLKGRVSVRSPMVEMGGDEINLNYEQNKASIQNGYLKSNNIYFYGETIEQTGVNQFHISGAEFTTCSNCPPTLSYAGSEIEAEIGGYAFIKNSFLRISGFPVLWLPYLLLPLKNERQTGLLPPEIGFLNNRKFTFSQSLFLAVSRSQDVTVTLKNYEIGGLKKLVEYRYAASEASYGEFIGSHINDSLFTTTNRYRAFQDTQDYDRAYNRWSLKGYSQTDLGNDQRLDLNLNMISDLMYPQDFSDEYPNYADSGLENRLSYTHNSQHTGININAIYYKHLLSADPIGSNSMAVHKLPELNYNTTIKKIDNTPFYYKFNLEYSNFARERAYDDISLSGGTRYATNAANDPACEKNPSLDCRLVRDGAFNEGTDLMRTGQRLLYKASLLTEAFSISDLFFITPEVSYNDAHYIFPEGEDDYANKRFVEMDVLARTKFYRIYEADDQTKYRHDIIPEVNYKWIPWSDEDQNLFFGTPNNNANPTLSKVILSDDAMRNGNSVQYDYRDRIYDRHLITLNLINRVIEKEIDGSQLQVFDFQLKQSYDLYQSTHGQNRNEPLSDLSGIMNFYWKSFTFSNQTNYFPYQYATNSTTSLTFKNSLNQYFRLGYISKRTDGPTQDDVSVSLGFTSNYVNLLTGVVLDTSEDRSSDSRIKKVSLIAQIKPPGECWAINLYREQKVGLEAEWKVRFDFSFDGKPTKIIPPQELNIN